MGTYSIRYTNADLPYSNCAVDWDWIFRRQWARSEREGDGSPWVPAEGLDEEAYWELLLHFGLERWADEYPPERVISMSPPELARERRNKEREYRLSRWVMTSDTLGYHVLAEEHVSEPERR